jgi:hypothetical protein
MQGILETPGLTVAGHLVHGQVKVVPFHIGMDRNFVCLWRWHNCKSQVIDLSLSALIYLFMKSIIGFLSNKLYK